MKKKSEAIYAFSVLCSIIVSEITAITTKNYEAENIDIGEKHLNEML